MIIVIFVQRLFDIILKMHLFIRYFYCKIFFPYFEILSYSIFELPIHGTKDTPSYTYFFIPILNIEKFQLISIDDAFFIFFLSIYMQRQETDIQINSFIGGPTLFGQKF